MTTNNSKKIIPIFYACDDNFVKFTVVSLRSLMENASKEYNYNIHILNTNISEKMQQVIFDMTKGEFADNFNIYFNNVAKELESIKDKLPIRDYYSKTTYYRLFIAKMFPEYEKAIYIDSDTVVPGDISLMYSYDLGPNYVGACHEQAMVQEDVYGTYVEKVLGINRNNYFNAGVLLINCRLFREDDILSKFLDLLHVYNFVVTQDEDYLNLICHNRVLWLPQQWNMEVFGTIPYDESTFKIIHYIMVSKPWHYDNCRFQHFFWNYASKTVVYDEILDILHNYSDEAKANDQASCVRLMETAIAETAREDNYLNMVLKNKKKSKERLEVLNKIVALELEGNFHQDVENDPPTRELQPGEVDYLRKKLSSKIKAKLTYRAARSFMNNMIDDHKLIIKDIKGVENIDSLNSGAIITCNHFNAFDSFAIQMAYEASKHNKKRKFFRVIREGNYTNFPGFYGKLMRNCYTLPLSSNKQTMKEFISSVDKLLLDGNFVLFYPEQSMWWNYRKPKPLKKGAYSFAAKNNVPVLPCFITMEDSEYLDDDGFNVQEYTIHICKPIYPNANKSLKENIAYMMEENYNVWKEVYESAYKTPLQYTCDRIG